MDDTPEVVNLATRSQLQSWLNLSLSAHALGAFFNTGDTPPRTYTKILHGIGYTSEWRTNLGIVERIGDNLVTQAAGGDLNAMTSLLERYGPEIRQGLHIERRWQSQLEADDVMQVTYLEAFLEIRRVRAMHGQGFAAWLQRIADNNLRDAIRGLRRRKNPQPERRLQPASFADSCTALWTLLGTTSTTPSRTVSRSETQDRIQESLERLPPDYRDVIRLYDLENRPIGEVAETLSRTQGAVHMLRARAHDRLRELLGGAAGYFSESP